MALINITNDIFFTAQLAVMYSLKRQNLLLQFWKNRFNIIFCGVQALILASVEQDSGAMVQDHVPVILIVEY